MADLSLVEIVVTEVEDDGVEITLNGSTTYFDLPYERMSPQQIKDFIKQQVSYILDNNGTIQIDGSVVYPDFVDYSSIVGQKL